jgi:hypothetical protein
MNRRNFLIASTTIGIIQIVTGSQNSFGQGQGGAKPVYVRFTGMHNDIISIINADGERIDDLTLDQLWDAAVSPNQMVVAVHCGRNNGGDGAMMYGLYYRENRMYCDGVVRFVPVDAQLQLFGVVDEINGGTVRIITGVKRDVCSEFYWNGADWFVRTNWYSGCKPADQKLSLNQRMFTAADNHDPHYVAEYRTLTPP